MSLSDLLWAGLKTLPSADTKAGWDKITKEWELFDLSTDRTETNNLAKTHPERLNARIANPIGADLQPAANSSVFSWGDAHTHQLKKFIENMGTTLVPRLILAAPGDDFMRPITLFKLRRTRCMSDDSM